ncbi:hypothetical protein H2199_009020 [Coniosporium tulheliwenetii]|uniref:Uncharacterized protein n=1 Tax=Coniosporium tulheliwenetii TaxID=3383036 RepID=A0ACC2YGJ8_9PEZI|nr:hypothetical protein H2199_009020 [Cladosporium sp. JES 115]
MTVSLADDANAVPLCPLCHRNFDDLINPGFIFFPCDIVFFETFEQADFRRRRERYFTTRTPVQRITPTGEDYRAHQLRAGQIEEDVNGGLYQRYMLYDYLPKYRCCAAVNRVGQVVEAARWHGDPMAALHRSFAALSSTVLRGLPLDKRMELQELQNLYIQNDASYMTPGAQDEHLDHPGSPRHSFESSGGFPGSHGHAYRGQRNVNNNTSGRVDADQFAGEWVSNEQALGGSTQAAQCDRSQTTPCQGSGGGSRGFRHQEEPRNQVCEKDKVPGPKQSAKRIGNASIHD